MSRHRQQPGGRRALPRGHQGSAGQSDRLARVPVWVAVAAVLVVVAVVAAGALLIRHHRQGTRSAAAATPAGGSATPTARFTDPALVATVVAATSTDVTAIASYDYRQLRQDQARGLAVTTGAFKTSYQTSMTTTVRSRASRDHVVQAFAVQNTAISSLSVDATKASAIVFGIETVTRGASAPTSTPLVIGVSLQRVGTAWLVSVLQQGLAPVATPPGTPALVDAAVAARSEVVALLSYTRAGFATDFERAIDAATGPLHAQLLKQQPAVLATMKSGGYDTSGAVVGIGVLSADGASVRLLVATQTTDIATSGVRSVGASSRLAVTMQVVHGRWLAATAEPVADA